MSKPFIEAYYWQEGVWQTVRDWNRNDIPYILPVVRDSGSIPLENIQFKSPDNTVIWEAELRDTQGTLNIGTKQTGQIYCASKNIQSKDIQSQTAGCYILVLSNLPGIFTEISITADTLSDTTEAEIRTEVVETENAYNEHEKDIPLQEDPEKKLLRICLRLKKKSEYCESKERDIEEQYQRLNEKKHTLSQMRGRDIMPFDPEAFLIQIFDKTQPQWIKEVNLTLNTIKETIETTQRYLARVYCIDKDLALRQASALKQLNTLADFYGDADISWLESVPALNARREILEKFISDWDADEIQDEN